MQGDNYQLGILNLSIYRYSERPCTIIDNAQLEWIGSAHNNHLIILIMVT